jgi:hypothetical protein
MSEKVSFTFMCEVAFSPFELHWNSSYKFYNSLPNKHCQTDVVPENAPAPGDVGVQRRVASYWSCEITPVRVAAMYYSCMR